MATTNRKARVEIKTHEGAPAKRIGSEAQLRRTVMACLLWEDAFYESGESVADRIAEGVRGVKPDVASAIAIEARTQQSLRHAPLLIAREMARNGNEVAKTLAGIIQRPDELTEFLSLYWKDGKCPLSAQVKKGLARAFERFDEYQLAKYNRTDKAVRLRDVLFLCHAKPKDDAQADLWKRLVDGKLETPDTWEVALSGGADKKEAFTRLLDEHKLGGMALLRNLRNMQESGVSKTLIRREIEAMHTERILPYRFIAAARYAPALEDSVEKAMFRNLADAQKLPGKTILLVDRSGSMHSPLSAKSDLRRYDAACGLAILLRELADCEVYTFNTAEGSTYSRLILRVQQIPARHGFALRDAMGTAEGGTPLGEAVEAMNKLTHDRLIVLTDEQSHDAVPNPVGMGYMINIANEQNGVGYGKWTHIDGWSESVVRYIQSVEAMS